eukprot:7914508-Pyramimonas_sp.AAC.1
MLFGVAVRGRAANVTPLRAMHDASLHHLSCPTDASQECALNRFLQVSAWHGLEDIFSIDGQSDLNARAAHLEYTFQLSGCRRPCVELMQSDD